MMTTKKKFPPSPDYANFCENDGSLKKIRICDKIWFSRNEFFSAAKKKLFDERKFVFKPKSNYLFYST